MYFPIDFESLVFSLMCRQADKTAIIIKKENYWLHPKKHRAHT